jgi:hypothetical protein
MLWNCGARLTSSRLVTHAHVGHSHGLSTILGPRFDINQTLMHTGASQPEQESKGATHSWSGRRHQLQVCWTYYSTIGNFYWFSAFGG